MDPSSDRYRVCPNDGVEFMATHRSEKFCPGGRCADEFHNRKKKEEAEKTLMNEVNEALSADMPDISESEPENIAPAVEETNLAQNNENISISPLASNISIIGVALGNHHHLKLHKDFLKSRGLVYEAFENRYALKDTELFVATYGPYAIAWGYDNHIILTHKTNIPWIQ